MNTHDVIILTLLVAASASAWAVLCIALAARNQCSRCEFFNRCNNEALPTVDEPDERPES